MPVPKIIELWKAAPGFPDYEVSNLGRARTVPRIVAIRINGKGYPFIRTWDGEKSKDPVLHRLVLKAFAGEPTPDKPICRHLDGNKSNNAASNLCWGTSLENWEDSVRHGTAAIGAKTPTAKLNETKVAEILARLKQKETRRSIAASFNVHTNTIDQIANNKSWRHVPR